MFCTTKDRIISNQKANVVYIIRCPGCRNDYVGKKDKNLITRLSEHGKRKMNPCSNIFGLLKNLITNYLNSCNNWAILQYLEAYYIKTQSPMINVGLKVSKELQLFK